MPSRNPWFGPWSDQFIFVSLIAQSNISVNIAWQHKAPCLDANMSDYFHKSLVMLPACLLPCHIFIPILKLGCPSLTTWLYYAPPFTIAKLKNITPKPMVNGTYNILYLLIVNKSINCVFCSVTNITGPGMSLGWSRLCIPLQRPLLLPVAPGLAESRWVGRADVP